MTDGTSETDETTLEAVEPSMEDILASIRQLIADDGEKGKGASQNQNNVDAEESLDLISAITDDTIAELESSNELLSENDISNDLLSELFDESMADSDDGMDIPEILDVLPDGNLDAKQEVEIAQVLDAKEPVTQGLSQDLGDLSLDDLIQESLDAPSDASAENKAELASSKEMDPFSMDNLLDDVVFGDENEVNMLAPDMTDPVTADGDMSDVGASLDANTEVDILDSLIASELADEDGSNDAELDSLISDLTAGIGDEEALIEEPKDLPDLDDMLNIDVLADDMSAQEAGLTGQETDIPDLNEILSVEDNLELAPPSEGVVNVDIVNAELLDTDISGEPIDVQIEGAALSSPDPDIEFVKTLMAELSEPQYNITDTTSGDAETVGSAELISDVIVADSSNVEEAVVSLDAELDVQVEEDGFFDDLLNDTLTAVEADGVPQTNDMLDEMVQEEAVVGETVSDAALLDVADEQVETDLKVESATEAKSGLSQLAEQIEKESSEPVETVADNTNLFVGVTGGIAAAVAAAPVASALDKLIHEDADLDLDLDVEIPSADKIAKQEQDTVLNDIIIESEPEAQTRPAEIVNVDAYDDAKIDSLVESLVEDAQDMEPISVQASVIDDIIKEDTIEVVDAAPETVEIILETSQVEIEDMASKAANNTILNEVTETAAASAFASLNQVVEEKNIVEERGERIGDIVAVALQPMLKEWLDANLKTIVERAVTKEVKRISSGK